MGSSPGQAPHSIMGSTWRIALPEALEMGDEALRFRQRIGSLSLARLSLGHGLEDPVALGASAHPACLDKARSTVCLEVYDTLHRGRLAPQGPKQLDIEMAAVQSTV